MATFVSDTFTDTTGVLLQNHVPEIGGSWVKRGGRNIDADIQSNALGATTLKNTLLIYTNSATPTNVNYDISINAIIPVGDEGNRGNGLIGRYLDNNNYYYGWYEEQFNNFEIKKVLNGDTTVLDSTSEDIDDGTFEFKFEVKNATKKFYLDSVEKATTTDNDLTAAGLVGIISKRVDTGQTRDSFLALDTAAPVATNSIMQAISVWWNRT